MTPSDAELARYVAGHASPAENQQIAAWLAESEANRARLAEVGAIWNAPKPATANVGALWSRVRARTVATDIPSIARETERKEPQLQRRPMRPVRTIASAAALLVAVGGTLAIVQMRNIRLVSRQTTPAHEYSTGRGEHVTVRLPDGSRVTLAPRTHVRMLPGFGGATREIDVDGEVVLDVVHDAARPFRVHSGTVVVEDVGTRFDIRAYAGDSTLTIAVADGAVSLAHAAAKGVVVRAGDVARLDSAGRITTRRDVTMNDYFGWTNGNLAFDGMPMDDVRRVLERWYDVHVRIDDTALLSRRVTAHFDGQGVHDMIAAIATTLDVDAEWRGNVVTLTKRP